MVRPKVKDPIYMSFKRVAVSADHVVLMKVYNNILLIVNNLQRILDEHVRNYPINLLNINIILTNCNKLYII
jgi:hypothetical protein